LHKEFKRVNSLNKKVIKEKEDPEDEIQYLKYQLKENGGYVEKRVSNLCFRWFIYMY